VQKEKVWRKLHTILAGTKVLSTGNCVGTSLRRTNISHTWHRSITENEERIRNGLIVWRTAFKYLLGMATVNDAITIINILHNNAHIKKSIIIKRKTQIVLDVVSD